MALKTCGSGAVGFKVQGARLRMWNEFPRCVAQQEGEALLSAVPEAGEFL